MTRYVSILKKAELFEKLAIYGDRRSFLKAIGAQLVALPQNVKDGLDVLIKDLSATKPSSVTLQNKLMDMLGAGPVNVDELFNLVQSAANEIPGDHTTQVQNALNLSRTIQQLNAPATTNSEEQTFPPDTIKSKPSHSYSAIPKETQDQLNKLLVPAGNIMPLALDGQLGPQTAKAIEIFKSKYNVPATIRSIKEVYLKENNPEIETKTPF